MCLHLARKLHAPTHADIIHQACQSKAVLRGVAVAVGTPQLDAAACFPDLVLKAVDVHRAADDLRICGKGFVGVQRGMPYCCANTCALSMCRDPTATSCSPSAPICSTVDANFLAMVPVAKIPHFITVPPGLLLWIRCVQYTMVFPYGKDSEKQKCPRRACSNSPGTDSMHRYLSSCSKHSHPL